MTEEALRLELLRMRDEDQSVRDELAAHGSLFEGYNPRMEEVHRRNAIRLAEIIEAHGWPGNPLVGEDGAEAAAMIAQHAIGEPAFQRRCLILLKKAASRNEVAGWQQAYLEDRILALEGKRQIYGTQYDWDKDGEMSPLPIEDPEHVDYRRREIELVPLAENTQRVREGVKNGNEPRPRDWSQRQQQFEKWARETGWRN